MQHSRRRLPAHTSLLRMVRTEVDSIYPAAIALDLRQHPIMHLFHKLPGDDATPDGGLIGHQDNRQPRRFQRSHCGEGTRQELDFRPVLYIVLTVLDEDPISIQKDSSCHSLLPSNASHCRSLVVGHSAWTCAYFS